MQTHEHTIMVWLEVWLSVYPCLLLGGVGNVVRSRKNPTISFFAVERGAGKKGPWSTSHLWALVVLRVPLYRGNTVSPTLEECTWAFTAGITPDVVLGMWKNYWLHSNMWHYPVITSVCCWSKVPVFVCLVPGALQTEYHTGTDGLCQASPHYEPASLM